MSQLLSCHEISKVYSHKSLFTGLSFSVNQGDRIGVIGANGVGKSTFLKILAGDIEPDDGQVSRKKGLKVAYISQDSSFDDSDTPRSVLQDFARKSGLSPDHMVTEIETIITKAGFSNPDAKVNSLSGGWRKRLSIVSSLIVEPDLLFLDEPTNHLDVQSVLWLEDLLRQSRFAWVVISHDRYFLDRTVTTTAEISPSYKNGILYHACGYTEFLNIRDEYFENLAKQEEAMSNKVRREVEWLRRGPKARTTKSRSRTDAAHELIDELGKIRKKLGKSESKIDFSATGRKSKQLIDVKEASKSFKEKKIFSELSLILSPGTVVGVLGPNGCGKSTLLKVIQKKMELDSGEVLHAPNLKIAYFDQNRDTLDTSVTLKYALSPDGGDSVVYRGSSVHVASWARRFQFDAEQLTQTVGSLSGGEQARILIARLMLIDADILILDEPTNDLDIQTLEVLEDSMADFPGAVVLVSHDRFLMSKLSDICVGFLGNGDTELYADYSQWEKEFRKNLLGKSSKKTKSPQTKADSKNTGVRKGRLSYKEKREYEAMEEIILEAEQDLALKEEEMNKPEIMSQPGEMKKLAEALGLAQEKVDTLYARWTELEAKLEEG